MPRIRFPHSVIVKSPGLLPMHYKVSELAKALGIPERTLRDWLVAGAPHFRDQRDNLWIYGRDFSKWVASLRKQPNERKLKPGEAFCMRCNKAVLMRDVCTHTKPGKLILLSGTCPNCGSGIWRGGRVPVSSANNTTWKDTRNHD